MARNLVNKVRKVLWDQNPDKDVWKDPDPDDLTIDNAYKTRWIWYHTILGLLALMVNIELLAIIIILAVKL